MTIDRRDESKDYCPENCRWIPLKDNAKYKSTTSLITANNETHTGKDWAKILGFGENIINTYVRMYGVENTINFIETYLMQKARNALVDYYGINKEVELQGYKVTFNKISDSKINSLVDSGKLFLFQIYNKDFAEKAFGNKNLHTLYWENLFSEENLKDICLKLNGEAELFYRPANENIKIVKHEKGSVLVNRTTTDGKSIPEDIYQEIYQFKNKMTDNLFIILI